MAGWGASMVDITTCWSASPAQLSRLQVEPVVWSYGQVRLPPGLLARYHRVWPGKVWAGSA